MIILQSARLNAQINLVPNGSFEILTNCPQWNGLIYYASPWFQPNIIPANGMNVNNSSSSDLFNSCSNPSIVGVPVNSYSFQVPYHGDGYAGIFTNFTDDRREYVEVKLNNVLESNTEYCISFYVVSAGFSSTNCIHLGFGNDSILSNDELVIDSIIPAVSAVNIISDTLNWTKISGVYIANGWEKYLIIGNLLDSSLCNTINPNNGSAYYYLDMINIVKCSDTLVQNYDDIIIPNIFTPNSDGINDYFSIDNSHFEMQMQIFNRWGESVFYNEGYNLYWDGRTRNNLICPDGVYYYIFSNNEKTYHGTILLHR